MSPVLSGKTSVCRAENGLAGRGTGRTKPSSACSSNSGRLGDALGKLVDRKRKRRVWKHIRRLGGQRGR